MKPAITITENQTAGAHYQSVTGASFGKQLQTITNPQYAKANALIGNPNRPKLHRAGGRDSSWMRFKRTHPILIIEGGTEIYETEENGEDGGQINGIRGDVEFVNFRGRGNVGRKID
ncbi:hypothetical protein BCON_0070g00340 [Botryotinia convoluta]|uniref:Uncharacterized protein n=1 Tax=Botryotinia convoluta TaxID=54673 RepID=A0A4Z1IDJ2_9HELO|nr:hypothetical protein BCON_0070g00340 [Botryotinia convoluta]